MNSRPDTIPALIAEIDTMIERAVEQFHKAPADAIPQELALLEQLRNYLNSQPDLSPETQQDLSRVVTALRRNPSPQVFSPIGESGLDSADPSLEPIETQGEPDAIELENLENIVRSALSLDPPFANTVTVPTDSAAPMPVTLQTSGTVSSSDAIDPDSGLARDIMVLHSSLLQPLHQDLAALRQERDRLASEIQQLQIQTQYQNSLVQQQSNQERTISTFVSTLQERLQTAIAQQLGGMLHTLETRLVNYFSAYFSTVPASSNSLSATSSPVLHPAQRFEQVQRLQADSDRLLLELDGQLQASFNAVLSNIRSYEDSLATSVEKMHRLSQQGEAIVQALVDRSAKVLPSETVGSAGNAEAMDATIEPTTDSEDDSDLVDLSETVRDTDDRMSAFGVGTAAATPRTIVPPPQRITALTDLLPPSELNPELNPELESEKFENVDNVPESLSDDDLPFGEFIVPLEPEVVTNEVIDDEFSDLASTEVEATIDEVIGDATTSEVIDEITEIAEITDEVIGNEFGEIASEVIDKISEVSEISDEAVSDKLSNLESELVDEIGEVTNDQIANDATHDEISNNELSDFVIEAVDEIADNELSTLEIELVDEIPGDKLDDLTSEAVDEVSDISSDPIVSEAICDEINAIANKSSSNDFVDLASEAVDEVLDISGNELSNLADQLGGDATHEEITSAAIDEIFEEVTDNKVGDWVSEAVDDINGISDEITGDEHNFSEDTNTIAFQDTWLIDDLEENIDSEGDPSITGDLNTTIITLETDTLDSTKTSYSTGLTAFEEVTSSTDVALDLERNSGIDLEPESKDSDNNYGLQDYTAVPDMMRTGLDSRWLEDTESESFESSEIESDSPSFTTHESDAETDDPIGDPIKLDSFDLGDADDLDFDRTASFSTSFSAEMPRTVEEIAHDLSQRNATTNRELYIRPTEIESGLAAFFDLPDIPDREDEEEAEFTELVELEAEAEIETAIENLTSIDIDLSNESEAMGLIDDTNELNEVDEFEALANQVIESTDLAINRVHPADDLAIAQGFDQHVESEFELELEQDIQDLELFVDLDTLALNALTIATNVPTGIPPETTSKPLDTEPIQDVWDEPDQPLEFLVLSNDSEEILDEEFAKDDSWIVVSEQGEEIDLTDVSADTNEPMSTVSTPGNTVNFAEFSDRANALDWSGDLLEELSENSSEDFSDDFGVIASSLITETDANAAGTVLGLNLNEVSDTDNGEDWVTEIDLNLEQDEQDFEYETDNFTSEVKIIDLLDTSSEANHIAASEIMEVLDLSEPASNAKSEFAINLGVDVDFDDLDTDPWEDTANLESNFDGNFDGNFEIESTPIAPTNSIVDLSSIVESTAEMDDFEFDPSTFGQDSEVSAEDNWANAEETEGEDTLGMRSPLSSEFLDITNEGTVEDISMDAPPVSLPDDEKFQEASSHTSTLELNLEPERTAISADEIADVVMNWSDDPEVWEDSNDWYDEMDDSEDFTGSGDGSSLSETFERLTPPILENATFEPSISEGRSFSDLSLVRDRAANNDEFQEDSDVEDGELANVLEDASIAFTEKLMVESHDDLDLDDSEIFGAVIVDDGEVGDSTRDGFGMLDTDAIGSDDRAVFIETSDTELESDDFEIEFKSDELEAEAELELDELEPESEIDDVEAELDELEPESELHELEPELESDDFEIESKSDELETKSEAELELDELEPESELALDDFEIESKSDESESELELDESEPESELDDVEAELELDELEPEPEIEPDDFEIESKSDELETKSETTPELDELEPEPELEIDDFEVESKSDELEPESELESELEPEPETDDFEIEPEAELELDEIEPEAELEPEEIDASIDITDLPLDPAKEPADNLDALLVGMTTPKTPEISQNKDSDFNLFESTIFMPSSATPDPSSLLPSAGARSASRDENLVNDLWVELEAESQQSSSSSMADAFDWFEDSTADRSVRQTRDSAAIDIDRDLAQASPDPRRTTKLDAINLEASGVSPSDRAPSRATTAQDALSGDATANDDDEDETHRSSMSSRGGPPAITPDIPAASDPKASGAEVSNSLTSAPIASANANQPATLSAEAIPATTTDTTASASTPPQNLAPEPMFRQRPLAPQSSLQAKPQPPQSVEPSDRSNPLETPKDQHPVPFDPVEAPLPVTTPVTPVSTPSTRPIASKKAALKQQFSELPALDEWEAVSISAPTSAPTPPADIDTLIAEEQDNLEIAAEIGTDKHERDETDEESPIEWALDVFEESEFHNPELTELDELTESVEPKPVDRNFDLTIARLSEHISDDFVRLDFLPDSDLDREYSPLISPSSIDLATLTPAELTEIAHHNPFDPSLDDADGYTDRPGAGSDKTGRDGRSEAETQENFKNSEDGFGDGFTDGFEAIEEMELEASELEASDYGEGGTEDALFDAILDIVNSFNDPDLAEYTIDPINPNAELDELNSINSSLEARISAELAAKLDLDGLERDLETAIIAAMQQVDPATSVAPPDSALIDRGVPELESADRGYTPSEVRELDHAELFTSLWETMPPPPTPNDPPNQRWYLALDLGETELSALLIDRHTAQRYPLRWSNQERATATSPYRLPCAVYLNPEAMTPEDWVIGDHARLTSQSADSLTEGDQPGILLQDFRSCFEIGISWRDDRDAFQPIVRWSHDERITLYELRHGLRRLLSSLRCDAHAEGLTLALDLDRLVDSQLPKLAGIWVNQPQDSNAAYRFNLREALIEAGLVSHPGQVMFVDEAWVSVRSPIRRQPVPHAHLPHPPAPAREYLLVVRGDDVATTFMVCELFSDSAKTDEPRGLDQRSQRVPYGRLSLELDLIGQIWLMDDRLQEPLAASLGQAPPSLQLPTVGEPDPEARIALRQWLQATPAGRSLLRAARESLRMLYTGHDRAVTQCGTVELTVSRPQFERTILIPVITQLNREFNHILSRIGLAVQTIDRVILSGEICHGSPFETWLRQKCPNATIERLEHHDHRTTDITTGLAELMTEVINGAINTVSTVSPDRGASHGWKPDLEGELSLDCQRYDAYFVFHELLCNLPQQAITPAEARNRLERAGIPRSIVDHNLPELLANRFPAGLIPSPPLAQWLDPDAIAHPIYQVLRESPLFEPIVASGRSNSGQSTLDQSHPQPQSQKTSQTKSQTKFQPKFQHIAWMRQYLYCLTMSTAQTFQDPLCLNPVPLPVNPHG